MTEYKPGTCNINRMESKKRLAIGFAGFINAGILTLVYLAFPEFTALLPAVFLLYLIGFTGYIQYRNSFCAGQALKEKFHIGESEEDVDDSDKVSRDRKKAALIIIQSILGAALTTSSIYLVAANF